MFNDVQSVWWIPKYSEDPICPIQETGPSKHLLQTPRNAWQASTEGRESHEEVYL